MSRSCFGVLGVILTVMALTGTAYAAAPMGIDPQASEYALTGATRLEDDKVVPSPAAGDPPLLPLPAITQVLRHVARPGGSITTTAGDPPPGKLIYSSTNSIYYYPPRANIAVALPAFTTAVDGCEVHKFVLRVNGGVPGGTGEFACRVRLLDGCPYAGAGGQPIPGTERWFEHLPDDFTILHDLVADFSDAPIPIPPLVWVEVRFTTNNASIVTTAMPEIGYTPGAIAHPFTGCNYVPDGYSIPWSSFHFQLFANDDCDAHHIAYSATSFASTTFILPENRRIADDLTLITDDCELSAYEIGIRGTAGLYNMDIDLRLPNDLDPIPGTERTFTGRGTGSLEIARFTFPPGIFIPKDVWASWKPDRGSTGVVLALRSNVGSSSSVAYQLDPPGHPGWQPFVASDPRQSLIFYVNLYCRGDAPTGACCPDHRNNQPVTCYETMPITSCFGGRWLQGESCADAPFDPPCGAHACCKPDDTCEDLNYDQCRAVVDTEGPVFHCTSSTDCPWSLTCQADGTCAPTTGTWREGRFCDDPGTTCPPYRCFFGRGDCMNPDPDVYVSCVADADCPENHYCNTQGYCSSTRRGCGNLTCCNEVCRHPDGGAFCCDVQWDRTCVELASQICNGAPGNDVCFDPNVSKGFARLAIHPQTGQATTTAFNQYALPESSDPLFCCAAADPEVPKAGTLWYRFTALHTSARIHTCHSDPATSGDSLLQVFRIGDPTTEQSACASLSPIACNDDGPACTDGLSDLCVSGLTPGEDYMILFAVRSSADRGLYQLDIQSPCPEALLATACPDGPIDWLDPVDGLIDARQPHPHNDPHTPQGIQALRVAAPPGADNLHCWSVCESDPNGPGNGIASVIDNADGTFTVHLAAPLTPGTATRVTYTSTSGCTDETATFTAHPGDVNADGQSNARDILALVDCCLNKVCTPPHGNASCDINRSQFSNATDLIRLIDLLNGAAGYRPWFGTSPARQDCME